MEKSMLTPPGAKQASPTSAAQDRQPRQIDQLWTRRKRTERRKDYSKALVRNPVSFPYLPSAEE